ncbi:glucan biosynthesis protein G [Shewanella sp. GXUN23E]|uniref:glucan biosynthesis protein G n=1 Tax=Shewanella sp. GXUN23E TaxID=3422498 RepID=UPI003D7E9451
MDCSRLFAASGFPILGSVSLGVCLLFSVAVNSAEVEPVKPKVNVPPKAVTASPPVRFAKTGNFDADTVVRLARQLAAKPYAPRKDPLPASLANINYDEYRDIRFKADAAIWKPESLPYQMQLFHRGFYFQDLIEIAIVEGNKAQHLSYNPELFSAGEVLQQKLPTEDIGYSGLRLHYPLNTDKYFDELLVFQGASYFRGLGKGNAYGLSARGLAINTAEQVGEEFPIFRAFWVEKPSPDTKLLVVHALLDSPSVAGAYRFSVRPGDNTRMDVEAVLFPRVELAKVGLAPSTSMYMHSPNGRHLTDDFRPSVHDSDGLLIINGQGERLWRPLANPGELQISAFMDNSPQGFGLMQRERDFASYQDLEAHYERRPSLWVEPVGHWGPGAVVLTEIPTQSEIHDNIVAFWKPRQPLAAGSEFRFAYHLAWGANPAPSDNVITIARTSSGRADIAKPTAKRLFVLDYKVAGERPAAMPKAKVETSAGEVLNVVIRDNPLSNGYRLSFEFDPGEFRMAELRAELKFEQPQNAEVWLYRWTQ